MNNCSKRRKINKRYIKLENLIRISRSKISVAKLLKNGYTEIKEIDQFIIDNIINGSEIKYFMYKPKIK